MLSFKPGGRKIARVKGGKHHGKSMYLHSGDTNIKRSKLLSKKFFGKYKRLKKTDLLKLHKALNQPDLSDVNLSTELKVIFNDAVDDIKHNEDKKITSMVITDGKVIPLPDKNTIEKIYVSAPSGAGKSTWCGSWLKEFTKMFKDDDIYLFSSIKDDEALDKHNPKRIELTTDLLDEPVEPDEIRDSVAIFDDTDTIANPKIRRNISDLRDLLLECGRHYSIRMLVTSHVLMNYKHTKLLLTEATAVCFFPRGGSKYSIKIFLTKYAGLDAEQLKKILNLPSRWICIYMTYPMFVMYEKGVYLLS